MKKIELESCCHSAEVPPMSDEFTADLAVVIGIGAYDPAVGRLATPVSDAEAVANLLKSRFNYEVILHCDDTATLAGLHILLLDELPKRVQEGSRLLVYFAGHGVAQDSTELEGPQGYLVPYGATSSVKSHLPMSMLYEAVKRLSCRHLLVILDCCFAGSFHWAGGRPVYVPNELLYEERYRHWVRHPARWILTSTAHDEYALDTPDRQRGKANGHSPFAAALLDGLAGEADTQPQGGDGIVTLAELYAYVKDRLAPHQSPLVAPLPGQTRGEFVFRDPHCAQPLVSAERLVHLDESQNPYRGLKPYRAEHGELFFGRSQTTRQLLQHVRLHRLTVVVGPSGSGKSSLVQAGLLPGLYGEPDESWVIPTPLRVAGDPFAALHSALAAAGGPLPPSAAGLSHDPKAIQAWGDAWAVAHSHEHLLIVVDQAEELVTRVPPSGAERPGTLPEASAGFLVCLEALLSTGGDCLRVLLAVRSDYEPDLGPESQTDPLALLWIDGRFMVPFLSREELRQVIERPAGHKALHFDDPGLVDRLADGAVGMPGGLPLLSYALSRLYVAYLRNGRGDRLLTAADLATVGAVDSGIPGGIVCILREEANRAVSELPDPAHREVLWRVLLRMVHLVGARPARRQVPLSELDYPQRGENDRVGAVLRRFIDEERLLVSDRAADLVPGCSGGIELAHDELLASWPELARQIDATRDFLPIHRRLSEAATVWSAGNGSPKSRRRRRDLDLRLLSLVEASGLPREWLNRVEAEYMAAAHREHWRRTVQRWMAAAAILLLTSGAALFFYNQSQRDQRLRYQSIIQGLVNQAETDLEFGERTRALLLTRQAFGFLPKSEGDLISRIDRLFRRMLEDLPPHRAVLRYIGWDTRPMAFHPSSRLLVVGLKENLVLITLPSTGIVPAGTVTLSSNLWGESAETVAFSSDGHFLATGFNRGSLCVWRFAGMPPAPLSGKFVCLPPAAGRGAVTGLAFRPRQAVLVVGRDNGGGTGSLQVWKVDSGRDGAPRLELRSERPAPGAVNALVVSAAGEMFVSIRENLQVSREIPAQVLRGQVDNPAISLQRLSLTPRDPGHHLEGLADNLNDLSTSFVPFVQRLELAASDQFLIGTGGGKRLMWELSSGAAPFLVDRELIEGEKDPSGKRVASSGDGAVFLWNLQPLSGGWIRGIGRERTDPFLFLSSDLRQSVFLGSTPAPTALVVRRASPSTLAVGLDTGDVEIYDPATGKWSKQMRPTVGALLKIDPENPDGDARKVSSLVLSPNSGYHVLGADGLWWRIHQKSMEAHRRWLNRNVCAAAGSADGAWLATLSNVADGQILLEVWTTSGDSRPEVHYQRSNKGSNSCRAGLVFHPTHTELAVGIGPEVTVWSPVSKGQWMSWRLAEFEGRINTLAWSGDLLAAGGEGFGADGSIELLLASTGKLQHRLAIPGAWRVTGLAFEPEGRRLAASTDGPDLRIWNLDALENPPIVLGQESEISVESPVFLEHNRIAALTGDAVSVWNLSTERLAEAACNAVPRNLGWYDWIAYVDRELARYVPTCPGLDPDPFLLAYADSLAEKGNEAEARRLYRRLNELRPGTVVNITRRAYGARLASKLNSFKAVDRQGVLSAMARVREYETLRQLERLPPLSEEIQLRLCRRGALLGEPERALTFCDGAVELSRDNEIAHDSRGLARALVGNLRGAREDFIKSRDFRRASTWRTRRQAWIDALGAQRNPITPEILRQIAREELENELPSPRVREGR